MMPDKSSSWFLWVEERQKEYLKKKKSGKGKHFKCYTLGELFKMIFWKNKDEANREKIFEAS